MAGFRTAQEKSITQIGEELKSVYQAVLELPYDHQVYAKVTK
jgi:1,2-diacylglycerol-3-alpha-glucose alpha-1,2-glucosyltransferase